MRGLVDDLPYSEWKLQVMQKEQRSRQDWHDSAVLGAMEAASRASRPSPTSRAPGLRAAAQAGLRGIVYREVATMDKSQVEPVMQRARGHRRVAGDERPEPHRDRHRAARSVLVPPGAVPARCRVRARTACRSRSTWPAARGVRLREVRLVDAREGRPRHRRRRRPAGCRPASAPCATCCSGGCSTSRTSWRCTAPRSTTTTSRCSRATTSRSPTARAATRSSAWASRRSRSSCARASASASARTRPASNTMDMFDEMRIGLLLQRARSARSASSPRGSS